MVLCCCEQLFLNRDSLFDANFSCCCVLFDGPFETDFFVGECVVVVSGVAKEEKKNTENEKKKTSIDVFGNFTTFPRVFGAKLGSTSVGLQGSSNDSLFVSQYLPFRSKNASLDASDDIVCNEMKFL